MITAYPTHAQVEQVKNNIESKIADNPLENVTDSDDIVKKGKSFIPNNNNRNGYIVRNNADLDALIYSSISGNYVVDNIITLNSNKILPVGVNFDFRKGVIQTNGFELRGNNTSYSENYDKVFHVTNVATELTGTWRINIVRPEHFGAKKDGTDDYTYMQQAVDFAKDRYTVKFTSGQYTYGTTLQINHRNCKLLGDEGERSVNGGTRLNYTGTVAAIQIGQETVGRDWRDHYYDGYSGFNFEKINLRYGGTVLTPMLLRNDINTATNCDGIIDWYGGSIIMNDVIVEKFTNNFKGIQSDVNTFNNVTSLYSRYGFYLSRRSDQNTFNDFYTFYCDTTITLDGCSNTRINSAQIVNCGAVGQAYAIDIRKGTFSIDFNDCWFEAYTGGGSGKSYVGIGVTNGYNGVDGSNNPLFDADIDTSDIVFSSPFMQGGTIGSDSSSPYLCDVGRGIFVVVRDPSHTTSGLTNVFTSLVNFVGDYNKNNSQAYIQSSYQFNNKFFTDSTVSGGFSISLDIYGQDVMQKGNRIGRFDFLRTGNDGIDNTQRTFRLSATGDRVFNISFPNDSTSGNANVLNMVRRRTGGGVVPISGTYEKGDFHDNSNPTVLTDSFSNTQYVILGWSCTISGTPGTWKPINAYIDLNKNLVKSYTGTQFSSITSLANTSYKNFGVSAYDTTTNRPVYSGGATSASVWRFADGTLAYAPV
jgi:transcription elongation factor Elf1